MEFGNTTSRGLVKHTISPVLSQETIGKGRKIEGKTHAKSLQEEAKEEEKVEQKRSITNE